MIRNYPSPDKKTARLVIIVSGLLFWIFSLTYLAVFQGDLLTAKAETYLSGKFTYQPWIGAVIITFLLWLLQRGVNKCNFKGRWYSLSYAPSFILLGALTYHEEDYIPVFLLVVFTLLIFLNLEFRKWNREIAVTDRKSTLLQQLNVNILEIVLLCLITVSIGNTDRNLHYELAIGRFLKQDNPERALQVGKKSLKADQKLTALRVLALSRAGKVGEALFEYPQDYSVAGLLIPESASSNELGLKAADLYSYWGETPAKEEQPGRFFERFYREQPDNPVAFDYYMASLLLSKDLKTFQAELSNRDSLFRESLPRHYAEAVILYKHLHPELSFSTDNEELNQRFAAFLQLRDEHKTPVTKENYTRRQYGNTYWWYYLYK